VKNPRILFVTDYIPTGGSRTYLAGLLKAMAGTGSTIILFTKFPIDEAVKASLAKIDFHVVSLSKNRYASIPTRFWCLFTLFSSKKIIPKKYKLVLVDFIFNLTALTLISPFSVLPRILYQLHGLDYKEKESEVCSKSQPSIVANLKQFIRKKVESRVLNSLPARIVVFSKYAKSLLFEEKINNSQLVAPGFGFIENGKSSVAEKKVRNSIVISSRIEPRKGVSDFFTKVLPLISSDLLASTDVIVLSNFYKNIHLDSFFEAISANLCDNIQLIHNPSEKKRNQVIRDSSLVVLPSLNLETYGFSAQESLLSGIPVVAYKHCSYPEFIPDEMLATNEKEFAIKIELILKNSQFYRKLSLKAGKQLRKKLSWKKYFNTLHKLI